MGNEITLDNIIEEAYAIKTTLRHKFNGSKFYVVGDTNKYEQWKYKTLRFLSVNYPDDRVCQDYTRTINNFHQADLGTIAKFDAIIGVLESFRLIPEKVESKLTIQNNKSKSQANIVIHNTNNQSQQQTQSVQIFLEVIKDVLTGKQQKELEALAKEELPEAEKRTKIINKLKSFGSDILSNIIANVITNPAIWG